MLVKLLYCSPNVWCVTQYYLMKRLSFPALIITFFLTSCQTDIQYYLRNTSEYDQQVIISLDSYFEEQKMTKLELKYNLKVVKIGKKTHKGLKGVLKPKYLNDRQLQVKVPGESTLYINAKNPGFSNLIFRNSGIPDTLFKSDVYRWQRNGKSGISFYYDLK